MGSRANSRNRILDCAQSIVLQKGFASTSIDEILEMAAITKGGFFYHFDGKLELAKALITRYLEEDERIFTELFDKATELTEDPLHQLLIFLKLFADLMSEMEDTHPGCLVASFTYETQQFDDEVRELVKQGLIHWRQMILNHLELIREKQNVSVEISLSTLADMFSSIIEGGIILSRAIEDKQALVDQILAYRNYLRLLFEHPATLKTAAP